MFVWALAQTVGKIYCAACLLSTYLYLVCCRHIFILFAADTSLSCLLQLYLVCCRHIFILFAADTSLSCLLQTHLYLVFSRHIFILFAADTSLSCLLQTHLYLVFSTHISNHVTLIINILYTCIDFVQTTKPDSQWRIVNPI